jgi:hypothetical protein
MTIATKVVTTTFFIIKETQHVYYELMSLILPNITKASICFVTSISSQNDNWFGVLWHGKNLWVFIVHSPTS